jgi:CRISPR-associated protein Csx17
MTTSELHEIVLEGCAPVPLANYLKALGVFRLVAEQADAEARGSWRNERFVLRTRLPQDELLEFFVHKYEPSPIISPWNGRAGFLEGEEEDSDEKSSREGAELIRQYQSAADRFYTLRTAVQIYHSVDVIRKLDQVRAEAKALQERRRKKFQLSADERDQLKKLERLIRQYRAAAIVILRSEAPDGAVDWFDACQRITQQRTVFPLLGSGGLDGSRDFGVNFGTALTELFDIQSGHPREKTAALIRGSLGFAQVSGLKTGNLGQFEPGGGGENTTTGFAGDQPFNPADFVFLLEGTMLFSGAVTRRLGSSQARLAFPFTVTALTAGSGATAYTDDSGFAEFWAPIWTRPCRLDELRAFLTEGRAVVAGKTAEDGLEFAIAVNTLGSQRGVPEYQRFALLQREPKNPKKATPVGRVQVRANPRASLVSELDAVGWLSRARRAMQNDKASAGVRMICGKLDESLFCVTVDGSTESAQEALIAIGIIVGEAARRPKLRKGDSGTPALPPPPRLSDAWVNAANDGSHEFALAAALASVDASAVEVQGRFRLPFRRHLAPLDVRCSAKKWDHDSWDDSTKSKVLAVWAGRDLLRDMAAVLERRLFEAERRHFASDDEEEGPSELPLRGRRAATLASVAAFLEGTTDDGRIARLAAGLAWARISPRQSSAPEREDALPFAYAALKPLFEPAGIGPEPQVRRVIHPLRFVRLLRAGRTHDAVSLAQSLARGARLPAPFARVDPARTVDPTRLAASLLLPIASTARDRLVARAYPNLKNTEEESDVA